MTRPDTDPPNSHSFCLLNDSLKCLSPVINWNNMLFNQIWLNFFPSPRPLNFDSPSAGAYKQLLLNSSQGTGWSQSKTFSDLQSIKPHFHPTFLQQFFFSKLVYSSPYRRTLSNLWEHLHILRPEHSPYCNSTSLSLAIIVLNKAPP